MKRKKFEECTCIPDVVADGYYTHEFDCPLYDEKQAKEFIKETSEKEN